MWVAIVAPAWSAAPSSAKRMVPTENLQMRYSQPPQAYGYPAYQQPAYPQSYPQQSGGYPQQQSGYPQSMPQPEASYSPIPTDVDRGLVPAPLEMGNAVMTTPPSGALVVIRFNKPNVYFDKALYEAVAKAVSLKPTLTFNVVSYVPLENDPMRGTQLASRAGRNQERVLALMNQIGVPSERIASSSQPVDGLRYDEVHVFVQ